MIRKVSLVGVYVAQRGLFARVAQRLGLDPSYVSRVARGTRQNANVARALEAELRKSLAKSRKVAQPAGKR